MPPKAVRYEWYTKEEMMQWLISVNPSRPASLREEIWTELTKQCQTRTNTEGELEVRMVINE